MKFDAKNLAVAAFWLLLAACSRSPEPAAQGNVFRYAVGDPVASLDPAHATPPTARMLSGAIYDTLYRYQYLARPYQLTPGLAVDFPDIADDGLSYTISIREGVLFHPHPGALAADREVTADDVIYSMLRHFDPAVEGQAAWLWNRYIAGVNAWRANGADYDQPPEGLQVLDDHTLKITLTRPYADFVHTLALPVAAIVSRHAIEHYGDDYPLNPVGTGPYRLSGFSTAQITLVANPEYNADAIGLDVLGYRPEQHEAYGLAQLDGAHLPLLDAIEVRFIRDADERWQALREAQVDGMLLPATLYDQALATRQPAALKRSLAETLHVNRQPLAQLYKIDFNMADVRLGDVAPDDQRDYNRELRCALRQAFDWRGYNEEFFGDVGYIYAGVVPPLVGDYPVAEELTNTERLFAGFELLPVIEFGYSESELNARIFEYFQNTLGDAGYPPERLIRRSYSGFSAFAKAYSARELPLVHTGWALDYPGPLNTLQLYTSDNASPGPGVANYANPEFDELYTQAFRTLDSARQSRSIRQMQQLLDQDCVSIAGFSPAQLHVWRKAFVAYPDSEFASGDLLRYVMPIGDAHTAPASGKLSP